MEKYLKQYGVQSLTISAFLVFLSIFLIFRPIELLNVIFVLLGCVIAVDGLVHAISYFSVSSEFKLFSFELIQGIIEMVIGILLVAYPQWLSNFLPYVVGSWIIIESIIRFQISINLRQIESVRWILMTILSIFTALLGVLIIMYPVFSSTLLVSACGIVLLVTELFNIIESIFFMMRIG